MTHASGRTFTPSSVSPGQRDGRSEAIELTTVQRPASLSSAIGDTFGTGGLSTGLELDLALTPIESATTVHGGASVRTLGRSVEAGLASEATLVNTSALPPVDTGFGAWSFLVAAFVVDAIVDGFPLSYGILLNAYLRDEHYRTQKFAMNLLPLIGTLSSGLNYCSSILIQPFISQYPQYRRLYLLVGVVISFISLYAASYVTKLTHLLLLQGIVFGFGSSLVTSASTAYIMSEWFVEKRELANMIMFSGPAAGGVVYPFIIFALLRTRTVPETLRVLSFLIPGLCSFPTFPQGSFTYRSSCWSRCKRFELQGMAEGSTLLGWAWGKYASGIGALRSRSLAASVCNGSQPRRLQCSGRSCGPQWGDFRRPDVHGGTFQPL